MSLNDKQGVPNLVSHPYEIGDTVGGVFIMKKCLYCGKEFESKGKQKFCSRECTQKNWHKKNYKPIEKKIYKNKCLFCGKEYETSKPSKHCSDSCRQKYKIRLKKKYCLNCNKEIDVGKRKFCDDECMNKYYIKYPKYTKECIYCGKEFKTNTNKQKLCGADCQHEYEQERRLKVSQKQFKKKFESNHPNFLYIDGYTNYESIIRIQCKLCGEVLERAGQYGSPSRSDSQIQCDGCIKIRQTKVSLLNILVKIQKNLIREENKVIRENELEQQRVEREDALSNHICEECGKKFESTRMGNKYCSIKCKKRVKNRMKEISKYKLKDNGLVDYDITLKKLFKRDKGICHICGSKCDYGDCITEGSTFIVGANYPSVDHVFPKSKGGTHTWDNVKLAHIKCNSIKNNKVI